MSANQRFGLDCEIEHKSLLEEYFNTSLDKTIGKYNPFDFKNDEEGFLIELKSRRSRQDAYTETMVGYNKVQKGHAMIQRGYKVYFVFNYTDRVSFFELKNNNIDPRWVRSYIMKDYLYIPTSKLNLMKIKTL